MSSVLILTLILYVSSLNIRSLFFCVYKHRVVFFEQLITTFDATRAGRRAMFKEGAANHNHLDT